MSRWILLSLLCLFLVSGCTTSTSLVNDREKAPKYPSPFSPHSTISFKLSQPNHVTLIIFDIFGKIVDTLVNDELQAGHHSVRCDDRGHPSGVYFYKIKAGEYSATGKALFFK